MNPAGSAILIPLGTIYSAVTRARLAAYRRGLFSVSKLAAPVLSIGNLTAGGTGKTPLVEWVCRALARGSARDDAAAIKKVCVLTRGYGRENPKTQVVVSDGAKLLAGAREAGDEPSLLAKNLLGVAAVICNPDRLAAGQWAIEHLHTEVFVLDDGFQHLRLSRDLDIVIIDATNPWGGGRLLPYGRLREPVAGLSRADCVVITRADQVENLTSIKEAVQRLAGDAPIFSSRMLSSGIRRLDGERIDPADSLTDPVGAFCGVGNPKSFFNHLRGAGYQLAFTRTFTDHHKYTQPELDALVEEARRLGIGSLVTTAKDAIKLNSLDVAIPCYVLDIEISLDEGERLAEIIQNTMSQGV
ncbi:MAG TPA: tetraacyldisaccharide 4'-kinase [Blastocatellia bacterium]|jgi:tetraacyldisaccharide 4'-kinase|nr:tetraacyldisaccharide 4'-kinase [Blastocatellia bacterium]HAF21720.1 tetraacyldisaccharide 4'-kinase [Blastocatellia bacterium]HCX28257.1 tetraacyldisaccharide 4'-kinase [Blastocatellia bacterium]